jgi:GNAT superfamily N-acetyltransferase
VAECVGPASFTTNDECGLLVEGFEHPPLILTTQNPPYYEHLWTGADWHPVMDLWAWRFDRSREPALSDRQQRALDRLQKRADLHIRPINRKRYHEEVSRFFEVYQSGWARNWGFAPMTEEEIRHLAKSLRPLIIPDMALVGETADGRTIAVSLTLPDVNQRWRRARSGRLLPTGWWHLLRAVRRPKVARVIVLGVRPEHQSRAVGPLLYTEAIQRLKGLGVEMAEGSWTLATNDAINKPMEAMGGVRYKTWRLYRTVL